jgi:hypothetical protein
MSDSYLAIAQIAENDTMLKRMRAAAVQQAMLGGTFLIPHGTSGNDPVDWVTRNRYQWAASPGWGEAWAYALNSHPDDPDFDPGADEGVITDSMILSAVQHLTMPEATAP